MRRMGLPGKPHVQLSSGPMVAVWADSDIGFWESDPAYFLSPHSASGGNLNHCGGQVRQRSCGQGQIGVDGCRGGGATLLWECGHW